MVLGLEQWFYNFTQISRRGLTPEYIATVPRPYTELAIYGFLKGGEVTSFLGGLIVHPIYRAYLTRNLKPAETTPNSHKIIRSTCRKLQGRMLLAGLALGPMVALLTTIDKLPSQVAEKCYAIRRNAHELTLDRCALCLGLIGWYWRRFQGAVDGVNVGITYALFNIKILTPYTTPMMKNALPDEQLLPSVDEAENRRSRIHQFLATNKKLQGSETA